MWDQKGEYQTAAGLLALFPKVRRENPANSRGSWTQAMLLYAGCDQASERIACHHGFSVAGGRKRAEDSYSEGPLRFTQYN